MMSSISRDGFGPGPAQPKSARAYIPTWPKIGPGPKAAQETSAQIGLGPNFFGPGPAQKKFGPDNWPKMTKDYKIWPKVSALQALKSDKVKYANISTNPILREINLLVLISRKFCRENPPISAKYLFDYHLI